MNPDNFHGLMIPFVQSFHLCFDKMKQTIFYRLIFLFFHLY